MRVVVSVVALLGLVLFLNTQFPGALTRPEHSMRLVYLCLFIVLMATGSGMARRMTLTQGVRDAMVWLAIIAVLVLGYSMRGELRGSRFMAALMPSRIHASDDGGLSIDMAQDGHFHMEIEVNGTAIDFMVDTGASDIVLSPDDARRAGYEIETLNYSKFYNTANGTSKGAPVVINTMVVGPYTLTKVPASVNSASMNTSLLGMTFLRQFKEYRVTGDTLTLTP